MCQFWEVSCKVGEVVSEASDNVISQWAASIMEGLSNTLIKVGTLWVGVGTPTVEGGDTAVAFVQSHTLWLVLAVAIASIVVAGVQLAWMKRGEPARDLLRSMFTLVITSTIGVSVAQLLITASDDFSKWILSEASVGDDGQFATKILSVATLNPTSIGMIVIIVAGVFGLLANLVQIGLMFVRSAMLILLVGIIPLAGAATNTKWGAAWLSKTIGWFTAVLLFKPAASIVYAVAVKLVQGDSWSFQDDNLTSFVLGIVMMVLAVVSLPALMAFMVPATSAIASGGGSGATVAGAALATGAAPAVRSVGGGGGSAPSGGSSSGGGAASGGPSGSDASSGAAGASHASAGSSGAGAGAGAGSGATGGAAAGASGGAAAGGASAAGAAGAAGGPVGMAAGAAVDAASKGVQAVKGATQSAVADSTGAPSGAATSAGANTPQMPPPASPSGSGSAVEHAPSKFDDTTGASGSGEASR